MQKNRIGRKVFIFRSLEFLKYGFLLFIILIQTQLFSQQSYTFTSALATGSVGPTQTQINTAYLSTNLNGLVTSSLGIQSWTVPVSGLYLIDVSAAAGGNCLNSSTTGGLGARMQGEFFLNLGAVIKIIVGQKGEAGTGSAGGGGGTYVVANGTLLIAAGGGGGSSSDQNGVNGTTLTAGTQDIPAVSLGGTLGLGGQACQTVGSNGAGGGGYFSGSTGNGANGSASGGGGGKSFLNGGLGGFAALLGTFVAPSGGFGGGGGARAGYTGGGGGGGYSGGAGGQSYNDCLTTNSRGGGGGGGSYNAGTNQINILGYQSGSGRVIFSRLCSINLTSSGTNSLLPSICSGNSLTLSTNAISPFNWFNGNITNTTIVVSPTVTTTYSITGTATGSLSCQTTAYITVTVSNTLPVLSISNPSNTICAGQTTSLTAAGALTYSWTGGVVNQQGFMPTSTQIYTVSGQNGCGISTATTAIVVTPIPVNVLASPALVCEGNSSTLTAQSAVNGYTWQPGFLTGSLCVVSPLANTVYTVIASDGTCVSVATISVTTKTTPTITSIATSSSICLGDSVVLTASGGSTYTWTPGNLSGSTITVTPTTLTLYSVVGTNVFGCDASSYEVISVATSPAIAISANKILVCAGDPIILNASGANSYSWTNGPSTSSYTVNPTGMVVYTVNGLFTGNNCVGTTTILVNAITPSVSAAASPTSVCGGFSSTLTASGASSYTWTGFSGSSSQVVTPIATSVYTLIGSTLSGTLNCSSTNTVLVLVHPDPTITVVSNRSFICEGESEILNGSGAVSYSWSVSSVTTASILVTPSLTTLYTLNGMDAKGCIDSKTISITVDPCTGILKLNNKIQNVLVYPNPSNGEISIETDNDITLQLLNCFGEEVKRFYLLADNHHKVVIADLTSGIYFIVGQNNYGKVNQKIVVTK